jgi:hypothetical protein
MFYYDFLTLLLQTAPLLFSTFMSPISPSFSIFLHSTLFCCITLPYPTLPYRALLSPILLSATSRPSAMCSRDRSFASWKLARLRRVLNLQERKVRERRGDGWGELLVSLEGGTGYVARHGIAQYSIVWHAAAVLIRGS